MRESIDTRVRNHINGVFIEGESDIIIQTKSELTEYFAGKRKYFSIPLLLCGTEFQKSVWNELLKIEYGKTKSYLELSNNLKNPDAIRAVAAANGANAISIFIPCHRIIGSNGNLIGYAGGLIAKKNLLKLESQFSEPELF
jgi:methylated-DNA-[protein]-cysteine S-methyltransferase